MSLWKIIKKYLNLLTNRANKLVLIKELFFKLTFHQELLLKAIVQVIALIKIHI